MSSNIDLDVNNYDLEEILELLSLKPENVSKSDMFKKIDALIAKNKKNKVFSNFFIDLRERIEKEYADYDSDEVLIEEEDEEDYNIKDQFIIEKVRDSEGKKKTLNFLPFLKDIPQTSLVKKILNFDSIFRPVSNYVDICDPFKKVTKIERSDLSTDYTIELINPLKNVLELGLNSVEVPDSWYIFSRDYGTNYFSYTMNSMDFKQFIIEEGNFDTNELITELNSKSREEHNSLFTFSHTKYNNKIHIENTGNIQITIEWASNRKSDVCFGGATGQKLDSSLGWLLGFRNTENIINGKGKITSESLLDIVGPKYFLLSIEDFNNNKPNQDLIGFGDKRETFKIPSYWNRHTMDPGCEPIQLPKQSRCAPTQLNVDLSSNLTQKQKYTVDQIKLAINSDKPNRYESPSSTNLFARIPIRRDPSRPFGSLLYINNMFGRYTRRYLGPVTLKRFTIKLLNDKGFLVNLNGLDWSFSITASTLLEI